GGGSPRHERGAAGGSRAGPDREASLAAHGQSMSRIRRRKFAGLRQPAGREELAMNEGDVIFLSASVPIREGWAEDAQPAEIEEAIVSIARAVFARNGRLLFGGHPSVSPLVA